MSAAAPESLPPRGGLAIFHPPGRMELAHNPFGKDVANLQLWQALARHGGFEQIEVMSLTPVGKAEVRAGLLGDAGSEVRVTAGSILDQAAAARAGTLIRGQPE